MDKERFRILSELDVDAALKKVAESGFIPDTREMALAGLHKARLLMRFLFNKKQIKESKRWLRDNNYSEEIE